MRCEKLHGTWSEETCIRNQDADRIECRGCHHGAAIRKARERGKGVEGKKEGDVEAIKKDALETRGRGDGIQPGIKCPLPQGCGFTKDVSQFETDKRTKTGRSKYCKECSDRMNGRRRIPVGPLDRKLAGGVRRGGRGEKEARTGRPSYLDMTLQILKDLSGEEQPDLAKATENSHTKLQLFYALRRSYDALAQERMEE